MTYRGGGSCQSRIEEHAAPKGVNHARIPPPTTHHTSNECICKHIRWLALAQSCDSPVEPCNITILPVCSTPTVALKKKIANRYFVPNTSVADTCVIIMNDKAPRRVVWVWRGASKFCAKGATRHCERMTRSGKSQTIDREQTQRITIPYVLNDV